MTPGLAYGPPFPEKATRNAVVAVASVEKPTVPCVVGIAEIDISALGKVQGSKGHAVRSEHWEGDELWAWSSGGKPGLPAPDSINGWAVESDDIAEIEEGLERLGVENDEETEEDQGGVLLDAGSEVARSKDRNEFVDGEQLEAFQSVEEQDLTTKGMCR